MANTISSAKRARQAQKRQVRNQRAKSETKSTVKKAIDAIRTNNVEAAKDAYRNAIRALDKAVSKGVFPKRRASRKIGRLTAFLKKAIPSLAEGAK